MRTDQSIQNFFRFVLMHFYRISIHNQNSEIPRGSYIALNHPGWLDGGLALLTSSQPLRVLAKEELFGGAARWLFKAGGAIETDWKSPDRSAITEALQSIRANRTVAIFPEGTRCSGTYEWIRGGLAYAILQENRPIYPVAIFGSRLQGKSRSWIPPFRSRIDIVIGEPILYSQEFLNPYKEMRIRQIREFAERLRSDLKLHVVKSAELVGRPLLQPES